MTSVIDDVRRELVAALEQRSERPLEAGSEKRLLAQIERHRRAVGSTNVRGIIDLHCAQEEELFRKIQDDMRSKSGEDGLAVDILGDVIDIVLPELKQRFYARYR